MKYLFSKGHKLNLGRKPSKETRKKMSDSHIGHAGYWLGRKRPEEYRRRFSKIMKATLEKKNGRVDRKKNDLIHKIRHSIEMKLCRESVFIRDGFACVWCGDNKGGNLEADHIQEFARYPKLRFAIDNGRTLCKDCHRKRHKK